MAVKSQKNTVNSYWGRWHFRVKSSTWPFKWNLKREKLKKSFFSDKLSIVQLNVGFASGRLVRGALKWLLLSMVDDIQIIFHNLNMESTEALNLTLKPCIFNQLFPILSNWFQMHLSASKTFQFTQSTVKFSLTYSPIHITHEGSKVLILNRSRALWTRLSELANCVFWDILRISTIS